MLERDRQGYHGFQALTLCQWQASIFLRFQNNCVYQMDVFSFYHMYFFNSPGMEDLAPWHYSRKRSLAGIFLGCVPIYPFVSLYLCS